MTPYQLHVKKWSRGCGSCQCSTRGTRVVLGRGSLPCDVLFVGEAPGESENVLGRPFVGPAGKLLDRIVKDAVDVRDVRCAFTNVVGCIPREGDGEKSTEPDDDQIKQCAERLREFVDVLARPRLVVCVGSLARDWMEVYADPTLKSKVKVAVGVPRVHVLHPAAILRANIAQRELMVKRCVVTIRNAVEALA